MGSDIFWRIWTSSPEYSIQTSACDDNDDGARRVYLNLDLSMKTQKLETMTLDPSDPDFNVSLKFAKFVAALKCCEVEAEEFRGLVFGGSFADSCLTVNRSDHLMHPLVRRRLTAMILLEMIQRLVPDELQFVRPALLLTSNANDSPIAMDGLHLVSWLCPYFCYYP